MCLVLDYLTLQRQKEGKASPVRHSKDDSDTIDLAPSHFPPLPTSPLALFVSIYSSSYYTFKPNISQCLYHYTHPYIEILQS